MPPVTIDLVSAGRLLAFVLTSLGYVLDLQWTATGPLGSMTQVTATETAAGAMQVTAVAVTFVWGPG